MSEAVRTAIWPDGWADDGVSSPAIKAGGWVFCSAQLPGPRPPRRYGDPSAQDTFLTHPDEAHTVDVLGRLDAVLRAAGCELARDVMRIYWWIPSPYPTYEEFVDGVLWPRVESVDPLEWARNERIPRPQPASTGIGVRELGRLDARIAIGLTAFERRDRTDRVGIDPPETVATMPDTAGVRWGEWVFLVGITPTDWQGDYDRSLSLGPASALAPEARSNPYVWFGHSITAQVDYVLDTLEKIAEQSGTSLKRCVKAEVFMGHPSDFVPLDRAWRRWFPDNPPARMIVPYCGIGQRGCRVEIALTLLSGESKLSATPIETVDAPAPFGHEPQAVRAGDFLFLSTQLARDSDGRLAKDARPGPASPHYPADATLQMRRIMENAAAICSAGGTQLDQICRRHAFYDDYGALSLSMDEWKSHFRATSLPASTDLKLGTGRPLLVPGARMLMDLIAYVPS
jgi:enamine deaminase RidA (YjgF/YER057c/UK114 family)